MIHAIRMQRQARSISISRSILMSASYLVLSVTLWAPDAMAQAAAENQSGATALPPVVVATHKPKARRRGTASRRRTDEAAAKPKPEPLPDTQDSRTGTAGYVSNSTSVATKTNTP